MAVTFKRYRRATCAAALGAALALVVGACGSSAGDGGSGSPEAPAGSAGSTGVGGTGAGSADAGGTEPGGTDADGTDSGGALQQVSLVYDWSGVDFEAVPIAVAKAEGMFADHGIDVKLILPPDDSTTVKLLSSDQGDIGFATTADVVLTRQQGADVVSIGNYSQENNWGLIARPGESIDLNDLKGKKIGVFADNWTQAMMPFVLKKAGLSADDVHQITFEGDDVAPLLANKLDLTTNTANFAIAQVRQAVGKKPSVMLADEFDAPDVPVWVYIARESWLANHGDTAKAFLAATKEAMQWAIDHPKEAVADFEKVYPDNGSSNAYNLAGWQATADVMVGPDGLLTQRDEQWSELTDALQAVGIIDSAEAPSTYYTNEYLPQGQ